MGSTQTTKPARKRPAIPPEQARRVMKAIERQLAKRDGNASALARDLGMTQPSLSNLRAGKNGPSLNTARAVAALEGVDVFTLLGERAAGDTAPHSDPPRAA